MRNLVLIMILVYSPLALSRRCQINYNLNNFKYNCDLQNFSGGSIQFSSDCHCDKTAKNESESPEGPTFHFLNQRCSKASVSKSPKKASKYHNFKVLTYNKMAQMKPFNAIRKKYVNLLKKKCK